MPKTDPRIINVRSRDLNYENAMSYVYVGRYMPGLFRGSDFGNPFTHSTRAGRGLIRCATRAMAIDCYRRWLDGDPEFAHIEPERRQRILDRIPWLAERVRAGYPLACWCAPKPCHAGVLLERIDAMEGIHGVGAVATRPAVAPDPATIDNETA